MNRQMNKRSVVATLIVCLVCLVIVTGSTFSLFTSESDVNIAVTSGEVKLTAAIAQGSLNIYSKGVQTSGFVNGGSARLTETGLELMNITPGDKVTFDIKLENKSTIDIQYRVTWTVTTKKGEGDLANALVATAGDQLISTLNPTWTPWLASAEDEETINVAVELPLTAGNECQGEELTINFHVEAVQGNHADPVHVNSAANLQDAIDAGATEIILDGHINLSESITIGKLSSSSVYSRRKAKASVPADAMHINLNGYTITYDGTGAAIVNNSNVAITGGDISAPSGVAIQNNAVAVVESVDIAGAVSSSGALTLNESSITVSGDVAAISTSGTGSVVINSGSYANTTEGGVVISGNVTVNDGNFDGKVEANDGVDPSISGGNFTDKPADDFIEIPEDAEDVSIYHDINGITYVTEYTADGSILCLYLVPAEYKGDTVVVAEGTTVIGNYAFASNSNVKTVILADSVRSLGRGFDSSTVEKVVLNEGLEQIDSRAFRATSALKEVVFSSTVKTICDDAFQKTSLKSIVIPATVELVGTTAFGASLIESVTFKGNINIENKAFRGCKNLRTVIMEGYDVTFSNTVNQGGCWFCNSESNNANTSDIDFYVKTSVVKEKVLTAMGAERNNTDVYVEMTNENGYDVDDNGVAYVYTAEALKAANAAHKDIVLCSDITVAATKGGYNVAGLVVNGETIDGNGYTLTVTGAGSTWDCGIYITGGTVKNLVVKGAFRGIFTAGSSSDIYLNNVSFQNVVYTFNSDDGNGQYGVYATDCTFNGWTSYSNVHKEVVFTDCTFTEGSGYAFCRPYNATKFVGCTFTEGYKLDTSCVSGLVFDNCKYSDGLFYNGYNGAIFNGSVCVCTADELVAALEAKQDVIFGNDIKIEPAKMSNAYGKTGINVKYGQTIDGNGYTLNIQGAGGTWDSGINTTGGVIKNITITGSFRGIFVNHTSEYSEKVVLENVTLTGVVYTISCDQGLNQGLEATNCTFNGWTSFAATLGSAKFVNCSFGEGNGYAFCRPYCATEFVGCTFSDGYAVDTSKAEVKFTDCAL